MADFPQNPTKQPDPVEGYPVETTGYAQPATAEDIEKDESGVTYPNLHRRIDRDAGLYSYRISVLGMPILTDEQGNSISIPDIETSKEIIHSLITNSYDVAIITSGSLVKDYVVDYITDEVKFMWVIRSEDTELQFAEGYDLVSIANEVYRGSDPIIQPDTDEYKMNVNLEVYYPIEKDSYELYVSATNSFRTTSHHTYDPNLNSEIP